jgi:hypothetical protein
MYAGLKNEINTTFDELTKVFASFDDNSLNVVPFEGSWTAGQAGDHISIFLSGIPHLLNEQVEPSSRPYDENAAGLRELFSNYTIRMNAPDFTLPSNPPHDKQALLKTFDQARSQMLEAVNTLDLTMLCKSFELPHTGYLTRFEWLSFFVVHVQRHVHQLKNIHKALLRPV